MYCFIRKEIVEKKLRFSIRFKRNRSIAYTFGEFCIFKNIRRGKRKVFKNRGRRNKKTYDNALRASISALGSAARNTALPATTASQPASARSLPV